MTWTSDELRRLAATDDLHVGPFREDGVTPGTPTWIWSVVVDDALYVRAYNGRASRWYGAATRQKAGRIAAAGVTREVTFEPVDGPLVDRIDDALPREVRRQPVPRPDDRPARPLRDPPGGAAGFARAALIRSNHEDAPIWPGPGGEAPVAYAW